VHRICITSYECRRHQNSKVSETRLEIVYRFLFRYSREFQSVLNKRKKITRARPKRSAKYAARFKLSWKSHKRNRRTLEWIKFVFHFSGKWLSKKKKIFNKYSGHCCCLGKNFPRFSLRRCNKNVLTNNSTIF